MPRSVATRLSRLRYGASGAAMTAALAATSILLAGPASSETQQLPEDLAAHVASLGGEIVHPDAETIVMRVDGRDRVRLTGAEMNPDLAGGALVLGAGDMITILVPDGPRNIRVMDGAIAIAPADAVDGGFAHRITGIFTLEVERPPLSSDPDADLSPIRLRATGFDATLRSRSDREGLALGMDVAANEIAMLDGEPLGDRAAEGFTAARYADVRLTFDGTRAPSDDSWLGTLAGATGPAQILDTTQGPPHRTSTLDQARFDMSADLDTVRMSGRIEGMTATAPSGPGEAAVDVAAFDVSMPRAGGSSEMSLDLDGIAIPDRLRARIDPEGLVAREGANLRVALSAQTSGIDSASAAALTDTPVTLKDAEISGFGVTLQADGEIAPNLMFPPASTGAIDLRLSGLGSLVNTLGAASSQAGRSAAAQVAMIATMARGYLTPDGSDVLSGTVALDTGGVLTIDGRPLGGGR